MEQKSANFSRSKTYQKVYFYYVVYLRKSILVKVQPQHDQPPAQPPSVKTTELSLRRFFC